MQYIFLNMFLFMWHVFRAKQNILVNNVNCYCFVFGSATQATC